MQILRDISNKASLLLFLLVLLCSSCYHQNTKNINENLLDSVGQNDSSHFKATHHYSSNYNFVVKADSLVLSKQQPEETLSHLQEDSLIVYKNDHLVVADIRIMSADSIDSVWVQVARDQQTFGWIHESKLLPNVVPDDPISLFISTFSDIHLLVFLVIIVLISVYYIMRKLLSASLPIVHLRDINSIYPTLLVLLVATSATFYASIQLFAPQVWHHFYFHPTLNPFSVPLPLNLFLLSVWAILLIGLAAIDDVRHLLPLGDAVLYLCGLAAVCAVNYIIFSVSTLYYIGYPLLIVYVYWAIKRYIKMPRIRFVCGNCGMPLEKSRRCKHCGALNEE
ncbi:MAG: zinc ribbon domain-containing protein [Prevotella nanceiensis]|uniref:zinc ribbon domain-containing protein n=1 Tax=Hoylesella nanceiensis TaxID=425941 RepID=UPI001CAFF925|nr:zinc ribbon domain-containing protein [Hoylesella nanceiensis]MBF1438437.1 zinc ribbon domain-containing protein [Hoylesella nanceiensis]